MANTLLKIMERIVNDRLQAFIEYHNKLPNQFYGFRRGRSCSDCQSILHTDIVIAKKTGLKLGTLGIDLEGAYDAVDLEILTNI